MRTSRWQRLSSFETLFYAHPSPETRKSRIEHFNVPDGAVLCNDFSYSVLNS